jgi:hypothetical protein
MDVSGLLLRDRRAAARLGVAIARCLCWRRRGGAWLRPVKLRHRLLTLTLRRVV